MVGIPDETPENVLDTIKLNAEVKSRSMQVTIFQPIPGTDLYNYCKENGYLNKEESVTDFFQDSTITQPSITHSQVKMFRDYFKVLVVVYRLAFKLDGSQSVLVPLLDRLLVLEGTSKVLNLAYKPLNIVFRRAQRIKSNSRSLHLRRRLFIDRMKGLLDMSRRA